jgi:ABC-2 type transport system permease protein
MQVMRGVIEEKTNRVIEVLISSVKPFQLMLGKILGIGLVGFTQFIIWMLLSGIGLSVIRLFIFPDMNLAENWDAEQMANGVVQTTYDSTIKTESLLNFIFHDVNWSLLISTFVIYFVGGFLLYSSIFAMIGAMVDSETDTQQLLFPVIAPLFLAYIVSAMMIDNPSREIGTWFSVIPLTSPINMIFKVAVGSVELWQYVTSIVLLIGTFLGTTWVAAKIYRIGILMYGKKTSWKEVIKWIRYK